MLRFMREFWRALRSREGRNLMVFAMVREVPGSYGIAIRALVMSRQFAEAGENVRILEGARIRNPQMIRCGRNLSVGNDATLQAGGGITFGDDVLLGPGVKIWTQNHRSDDVDTPIREQGYEYKAVSIGDDCWIGANAFIMPGVQLPRGCVVAAGSVVGVKAYKEYTILVGNPARAIGFRKEPPKPAKPAEGGESQSPSSTA